VGLGAIVPDCEPYQALSLIEKHERFEDTLSLKLRKDGKATFKTDGWKEEQSKQAILPTMVSVDFEVRM